MNPWTVLGIEPTEDESAIKRAYMQKLPLFHPEEDQEGFRRLREAYEEALRSLTAEPPAEDDTPSGLVVKEFAAIYRDFSQRIDPVAWQKVLDQDVCQRIDMQQEIGEKLLLFFMQNCHLPHFIWKLLADFFVWPAYQDVLKQRFPPNYIDFVLNQSVHEDSIRYELFPRQEGLEYDLFIGNYLKLLDIVGSDQQEGLEALMLETDLLGIDHPDYALLKLRYYLLSKQPELALPLADTLLEQYPEDIPALHGVAQCWLHNKGPEAARPIFEKVLRENPEHYNARVGLANCAYLQEDYAEAKEKYRELLLEYPYDIYVANAFFNSNEKLIPLYEEKLAADKEDQDTVYKLASCYHNCRRFSEAQNLLAQVTPEAAFAAKHHNIYAYALMVAGEKEEALKNYYLWEGLEEDRLRVVRELPLELLSLGQEEEALTKCELYLQDYPQEAVLYDVKAGVLRKRKQSKEAMELIEQGLAVNKSYLNLHIQKAELLYELRNYGAALDSASAALHIYPYMYNMLLLQVKIYYDADDFQKVLSICETIDSYRIEDSQTDLYRALANINLEQEIPASLDLLDRYLESDPANNLAVDALKDYFAGNNDYDKALTYLDRAIIGNPEQPFFRLDRARIYRRQRKLEDAKQELDWIEQNRPLEIADFYNEKGFLYEALDDNDAARSCYEKAIALNEYDALAYGNLAGIFAQAHEYEKAVEYYTKQLAIREHPHYYISRGLAYGNLGKTEDEKADYLKTIELDSEYAYAYNNMGVVLYDENSFSEAVEYLTKALELEPGLLSSHQYLAKSFIALGQTEKALVSLNNGIAACQEVANKGAIQALLCDKLDLLRNWGRYEEALAVKESVDLAESADIYRTLGYCAYEARQDQLALRYLEKALSIDRSDAETYRALGHFYGYGLKRMRKAIKFCQKAVELDHDDYHNHLYLARIYELNEDPRSAAPHFAKALDLLLKVSDLERRPCDHYDMGDCYRGLQQDEKALDCYRQALEGAKSYPACVIHTCYESLFGLASLYEGHGDLEQARRFYDQTIAVMPDREYVAKREAFLAKQSGTPKKKGLLDIFRKR